MAASQNIRWPRLAAELGDEPMTITVTSQLEAALAERHFYSTFVVIGLSDTYETQAHIIDFLDRAN